MPVHVADFGDFERRMLRPSFADHAIDGAKLAATRGVFMAHLGPGGADFQRPMHVRLLPRA